MVFLVIFDSLVSVHSLWGGSPASAMHHSKINQFTVPSNSSSHIPSSFIIPTKCTKRKPHYRRNTCSHMHSQPDVYLYPRVVKSAFYCEPFSVDQ